MPTGYTAGIESGEITNLQEYALTCARAFGVCGNMRDLPLNVRPPQTVIADTEFVDAQIREAADLIKDLMARTYPQLDACARADYEDRVSRRRTLLAEQKHVAARYEILKDQVTVWDPPESLAKLREFMLQQIEESTRHSGSEYPEPVRLPGAKWLQAQLTGAAESLERAMRRRTDILQKTADADQWLAELWAALEDPE